MTTLFNETLQIEARTNLMLITHRAQGVKLFLEDVIKRKSNS